MFYFFKIPTIIQKIYPNYLWTMPKTPKAIYLTFDDGPTPEVTEWVLAVLEKYNAKATFFCEGIQVEKYPQILKKTLLAGHRIGNHSHLHRNGWKTKKTTYIADVERAKEIIEEVTGKGSNHHALLFRPPYGKIKKLQAIALKKKGYKIVMLDIMSGDFDPTLLPEKSLQKVLKHTKSGSIVIFHDYQKSFNTLQYVLPKVLEYWTKEGYVFLSL